MFLEVKFSLIMIFDKFYHKLYILMRQLYLHNIKYLNVKPHNIIWDTFKIHPFKIQQVNFENRLPIEGKGQVLQCSKKKNTKTFLNKLKYNENIKFYRMDFNSILNIYDLI